VNNNFQIVKKETINAYSDCNDLSKESRQLDFLASRPVTVKEAKEIMSLAVEGGYNDFKIELISILPQDSKIWIAREGSVCLYLDMPLDEQTQKDLFCDEYDQITKDVLKYQPNMSDMIGMYRIWWD
jgi:hypothetical protein